MNYNILVNFSNSCFGEYKALLACKNDTLFKIAITRAIYFAEGAIFCANKLPDGEEKDIEEKEFKVKWAESHKAYHYASESLVDGLISERHKYEALESAPQLENFANKLFTKGMIQQAVQCMDTVAWIFILLGDDNQKEYGKNIIIRLLYLTRSRLRIFQIAGILGLKVFLLVP